MQPTSLTRSGDWPRWCSPRDGPAAAAAAGIGDGVTFHDLRHYYASLLIRHGESVKVVQKRLGHKSAVETLDTYSHLCARYARARQPWAGQRVGAGGVGL